MDSLYRNHNNSGHKVTDCSIFFCQNHRNDSFSIDDVTKRFIQELLLGLLRFEHGFPINWGSTHHDVGPCNTILLFYLLQQIFDVLCLDCPLIPNSPFFATDCVFLGFPGFRDLDQRDSQIDKSISGFDNYLRLFLLLFLFNFLFFVFITLFIMSFLLSLSLLCLL